MKYKFAGVALIFVVGSFLVGNFINADAMLKKGQIEGSEVFFVSDEKCEATFMVDQGGETSNAKELLIPSKEQVKDNGFPKNENGETYGPDIKEFMYEPDLLLAINDEGVVGYIRQSDMDDDVRTPEQAIDKEMKSYEINMYLEDGETCIGTFKIN